LVLAALAALLLLEQRQTLERQEQQLQLFTKQKTVLDTRY
jgi:hypothetical protein